MDLKTRKTTPVKTIRNDRFSSPSDNRDNREPLLHSIDVCRQFELGQLLEQHHRVSKGHMSLTLLEGERGIGKNELICCYRRRALGSHNLLIDIDIDLAHHSHYVEKILSEIIGQMLVMAEQRSQEIHDRVGRRGDGMRLWGRLKALVEQMGLIELYAFYAEQAENPAAAFSSSKARQWYIRRDAYISILKEFLCRASQLLVQHSTVLIIHLSNAEFGHAELFQFLLERLSNHDEQPAIHILLSTSNQLHRRVSYMLSSLRAQSGLHDSYTHIQLKPLSRMDIQGIIEHQFPNRGFCSQQFTELVREKSGGNPGKIRFLLELLKEKRLLFLSGTGHQAEWYVAFDRVHDTIDLGQYYAESYHFIEHSYCYKKIFIYAACYGGTFSPALLKEILPAEIHSMILPAIHKGVTYRLLRRVGPQFENPALNSYQFTQVTIAENILGLEHQNPLNIIRMRLFDRLLKAYPYRQPFGLITPDRLARLINGVGSVGINYNQTMQRKKITTNFLAGFNALKRNDISLAYTFLSEAVDGIKNRHWRMEYSLAYHCYFSYIRCLYLKESYHACMEAIQYCLSQPLSEVDRGKLYIRLVYTLKSLDRHDEAIKCSVEGMSKLGLHLPLRPNLFLTFIEYVQCRFVLIGDIRKQQLPSCTDEKNRTLIKLLELAALSAYVVDLEFLQLSTCRAIRLSSQVGYTPFSFACLLSLNVIGIMGPHSKNMERFYELGTEPLRQLNKKSLLRETIYVAHRGPWREPLGRCIEALATLKREGPDYAEPEEVSVCNLLYYTLAMIKGSDHAALLADIQLAISRMDAPKYSIFNRLMRILAQVLDNQVNNRAHPTELNGPFFDERRELAVIEKGDRLTGFTYGIAKLYLSFHFGYHRDSHRFAKQCYKHRASVSGLLVIPAFRYMSSISQMLDFFETPPKGRLFKWLRRFTLLPSLLKNMLYFRLLMRRQESTFAFLYWCYRGVLMRTMGFGTAASARQSLERGIQRAEQEQYVQVTAMSYEMLGKLFPEDGYRKKVKQQAMRGYLKCANRAKVLQLKKELIGTFKV